MVVGVGGVGECEFDFFDHMGLRLRVISSLVYDNSLSVDQERREIARFRSYRSHVLYVPFDDVAVQPELRVRLLSLVSLGICGYSFIVLSGVTRPLWLLLSSPNRL